MDGAAYEQLRAELGRDIQVLQNAFGGTLERLV